MRCRCPGCPAESIEYIAADDVYAVVHSQGGVHLVRQSLDPLEERLDPSLFVRVHRSFIVQVDDVVAIRRARRGRILVMRSGAEVSVSRRRKDAIERLPIIAIAFQQQSKPVRGPS